MATSPRFWDLYPGPRPMHGAGTKFPDTGQKENTKSLLTNSEAVQAFTHAESTLQSHELRCVIWSRSAAKVAKWVEYCMPQCWSTEDGSSSPRGGCLSGCHLSPNALEALVQTVPAVLSAGDAGGWPCTCTCMCDFHLQSAWKNAANQIRTGRCYHWLVVPAVKDVLSLQVLWELVIIDDPSKRKPLKVR